MDWEQPFHFERQANARVIGEPVRGVGNKELSCSFPAPCSRVSFRVPLARGDLAHRLLGFHYCEKWLHRHHNGSVDSKSICQVLTSPLALDIWARVDKIAQTLVRSQTRQFQSLLRDLSPVIGRNFFVSRQKTTFFLLADKYPCVVLKRWKCFAIILYNVKHRHTVLSTFMTQTYKISITLTKIEVL